MNNMIKVKQVKVLPLHSENFIISNKNDLIDMVQSVPIVVYDYEVKSHEERYKLKKNTFDDCKLIGVVASHSSINIKDDFIVSDIYIQEEYKDYEFCNSEFTINTITNNNNNRIISIKKLNAIEFREVEE